MVLVFAGATLVVFLGMSIPVGVVVLLLTARLVRGVRAISPTFSWSRWQRFTRAMLPYSAATAAAALYLRVAILLLSVLASATELGYFSVSYRIIEVLTVRLLPSQASMEEKYESTRRRLGRFGERSDIWRETSVEAAGRVKPASLDFVYLDARHSYEGVAEDLEVWFPLVRPGGLMAGHDYNDGVFVEGVHGVRSAVDEFFGARAIPVRHTYTDLPNASWIAQIPRR